MPAGASLKKLFKSFKQRDNEAFYSAALEVIEDERQKKHNILAGDLQRILENENGREKAVSSAHLVDLMRAPKDRERGTLLFEVRSPAKQMSDMVLSPSLRQQVEDLIREYQAGPVLHTFGLSPRRKLLFAGPPGCGKTLCAEVIASEVGLPILYTRFDAVISSYLGETAANLRKVFDFAATGTWVVFFDEFDAIGKSRDDVTEHGELKRVVNTFLQLLDALTTESLFIAATNHESMLDSALWRRFDDILYFDKPSEDQITSLLGLKLKGFGHRGIPFREYAHQMVGWSHADVERVCLDAVRLTVLEGQAELSSPIFEAAMDRQRRRVELIGKSTHR